MVKCKVNPRREFDYPVIITGANGNVWLLSGPNSGTLLKACDSEERKVGYHSNSLRITDSARLLQGSITLSNK